MNAAKKFFLPCVCVAIAVFFGWLCLEDLFSDVALEQMLWHLQNAELLAEGYTDEMIIARYALSSFLYVSLAILIFIRDGKIANLGHSILGRFFRKAPSSAAILRSLHIIECCAGFAAIAYLGHFAPEAWQMAKMHFNPDSIENNPFIAENYSIPAKVEITFPDGRNNLVCILAESMEDTFADLTPRLDALRAMGASNRNMLAAHGTTWTIAAQTAWFFGLPLKTPVGINRNRYITRAGFLPGAVSIFDILAENGYKCVLVMGTDAIFGGAELLFSRHGGFDVRDKKYFISRGHDLGRNQGTEWGFSDKFVLARALEAYRELVESERPFVLFVATIDTHSPLGYAPPRERKFGDIRDAIVHADKNISSFVREIAAIPEERDRLALCVIGDHEYMGEPEFIKDAPERRLYNFFYGNIPPLPPQKLNAPVSALDIAPTLLQMAGARWGSDQFGLGTSLFSSRPALMEKFGIEVLDSELAGRSKFYESFY